MPRVSFFGTAALRAESTGNRQEEYLRPWFASTRNRGQVRYHAKIDPEKRAFARGHRDVDGRRAGFASLVSGTIFERCPHFVSRIMGQQPSPDAAGGGCAWGRIDRLPLPVDRPVQ